MKLKLSVPNNRDLYLDVTPSDTFQDLHDKVFDLIHVSVDLSQLGARVKGKPPFEMSTNVLEYFSEKPSKTQPQTKQEYKLDAKYRLCRLCSEVITNDSHFLFESDSDSIHLVDKVNTALPIHVTAKDRLPKQICNTCHQLLNKSYDFTVKVIDAQKVLEKCYSSKEKPILLPDKEESCPLCIIGHLKCLNKKTSNGPNVIRKDVLPKKEIVVPVTRTPTIKRESIQYHEEDEVVTGFWNTASQTRTSPEPKRYSAKKKIKSEDDQDWTIDEEYLPVSRRGRPKGTKNKPKNVPVTEKLCVMCDWIGPETDILAHAINQHCQPDFFPGYFPCPLCKANQPNELVLETHIEKHVSSSKKDLRS